MSGNCSWQLTVYILSKTTLWQLAITRSTVDGGKSGKRPFPLEWKSNKAKKTHSHKKRPLSPSKHRGNKGVKQKVPVKWLRDGHRTSSASTLNESVHCEAHNTQVDFPVNQSSQLPSTTSRHRANLAQDRRHVTCCLTQLLLLYSASPVRAEDGGTDSDL